MKLRLGLILCAFDRHRWCMYMCRSRDAERNTHRECGRCPAVQEREDQRSPWRTL